jgi:hypothetical protein
VRGFYLLFEGYGIVGGSGGWESGDGVESGGENGETEREGWVLPFDGVECIEGGEDVESLEGGEEEESEVDWELSYVWGVNGLDGWDGTDWRLDTNR